MFKAQHQSCNCSVPNSSMARCCKNSSNENQSGVQSEFNTRSTWSSPPELEYAYSSDCVFHQSSDTLSSRTSSRWRHSCFGATINYLFLCYCITMRGTTSTQPRYMNVAAFFELCTELKPLKDVVHWYLLRCFDTGLFVCDTRCNHNVMHCSWYHYVSHHVAMF